MQVSVHSEGSVDFCSKPAPMNPVGYLETNVLLCEDNLRALSRLPAECVDLIYLDPPFFSNRRYEVIWGDEAEVRSFEDRWEGGIENYLDWMELRLRQLHRILRPTGSLYLHCDPNASHYLKVACDRIFGGRSRFRSEIIWKRSSAHSDTRQGRQAPGSIHDTILLYTKGDRWTWNPVYLPYDDEYVSTKYRHVEPGTGRRYRLGDLTAAKPGGDQQFEWHGRRPYRGRHWAFSREKMDKMLADGRIVFPRKADGVPEFKRYLDEMPGVPLQDVWTDLNPINAKARERLGYPTQKPEALLERIVSSSSNAGDIVLDPFCGCGTTVAVAEKLGRQWLGIDISAQAISIVMTRLNKIRASPTVYGLPTTIEQLHRLGPFEFQHWIIQRVLGTPSARKVADMGIDGYSFFEQLPIQVKQRDRVGRNEIDNFETAVSREGKHKGYFVAFSFTRGAYEEAARAKRQGGPEILLVRVEDVVRVGNLIDSADRDGRVPDLSQETPDLMGLFHALQESVRDRPFSTPPRPAAKPSARDLFSSVRRRTKQQEALPV